MIWRICIPSNYLCPQLAGETIVSVLSRLILSAITLQVSLSGPLHLSGCSLVLGPLVVARKRHVGDLEPEELAQRRPAAADRVLEEAPVPAELPHEPRVLVEHLPPVDLEVVAPAVPVVQARQRRGRRGVVGRPAALQVDDGGLHGADPAVLRARGEDDGQARVGGGDLGREDGRRVVGERLVAPRTFSNSPAPSGVSPPSNLAFMALIQKAWWWCSATSRMW
jgi:hypothetical protein